MPFGLDMTERDGLEVFNSGRKVRTFERGQIQLDGPAVILIDPKFPHNVGSAVRNCSSFGIRSLVITGDRVKLDGPRLPREERMRGYGDVTLYQTERPFDLFDPGPANARTTFVALEVRDAAEPLPYFRHPHNPVYVFGPEDGSLGRPTLSQCHRFVTIPTKHCLNLAIAVGITLYDREAKACL